MPKEGVAWRSLASATLAPVFLIGGWTVAAALQPPGYSSSVDTISALAGYGATDRWVMTVALIGLGLCHLVTASGLLAAAPTGRWVLAVGGLATVAVAAFPLPTVGMSVAHAMAAGIAFIALSLWPALAWSRATSSAEGEPVEVAWPLRRAFAIAASAVLFVLLAGFVACQAAGAFVGGSERIVAGAQAIWPLVVVWSVWSASRRRAQVSDGADSAD